MSMLRHLLQAWYRRALAWEAAGRHGAALPDAQRAAELLTEHGWSSPQLESMLQRLKRAPGMAARPSEPATALREALPVPRPTSASCPPPAHMESDLTRFEAAFTAAAPELASVFHLAAVFKCGELVQGFHVRS